jgi:hypothetical protein
MRELEQNLDQLMRESKLCSVFLDNFIQPSDVEKIEKRAYLDKDKDIWRLKVFLLFNRFSSILHSPIISSSEGVLRGKGKPPRASLSVTSFE